MSVECNITKESADYYVEAYTVDCINDKLKRVRLAYVAGYRNYNVSDREQLETWFNIKKNITEAYRGHEDGYVTVELVIKEECINP